MIRIDALVARLPGIGEAEIVRWVERGWVRPAVTADRWEFADIDIARCRLILELRRDMGVRDDVMPMVLGLLDQVYDLRGALQLMLRALQRQPPEVRRAVLASLAESERPADQE
jgi:chaperone modulatory protein CbpM